MVTPHEIKPTIKNVKWKARRGRPRATACTSKRLIITIANTDVGKPAHISGTRRSTAKFNAMIAVSFITTAIEKRLEDTFCPR